MEEAVLAVDQRLVVDPPGVHLAESELGPLGHEAHRPRRRLVELGFVVVAHRGAVDDNLGPLDRLARLPLGGMTQLLEGRPLVVVDHQGRAPPDQVVHLPPLGD